MKRLSSFVVAIAVLGFADADAQEAKGFLNISGGYQAGSQAFNDTKTYTLYGENGRFTSSYDINRARAMVDVGGGVWIWRNMALGVSVSMASAKQTAGVTAIVPHPLFFGQPRIASDGATGLQHSEVGVHIQAIWVVPVSDRVDLALSVGPSIFRVKQDVVTGVTVREVGAPFTQAGFSAIATETRTKTAPAVNVGADVIVMFTSRLGGGLFVRYAGASADIALAESRVSIEAGGLQAGLGLRLRF